MPLKTIAFFLLTMLATSHAADKAVPVIKLTEAKRQTKSPTSPFLYVIPPADGLTVDAEGYTFSIPAELKDKPLNTMLIYHGKTRQYELEWKPGTNIYQLNQSTLKPRPGSIPFEGFKKGDIVALIIGTMLTPEKIGPVWNTTISVQ